MIHLFFAFAFCLYAAAGVYGWINAVGALVSKEGSLPPETYFFGVPARWVSPAAATLATASHFAWSIMMIGRLDFTKPTQMPLISDDVASFLSRTISYSIKYTFAYDPLSISLSLFVSFSTLITCVYSWYWLFNKHKENNDNYNKHVNEMTLISAQFNLMACATMMYLVAADIISFVIFSETITIFFSFLTLHKHNKLFLGERADNNVDESEKQLAKNAFPIYHIFSHIGSLLVTIALLMIYSARHGDIMVEPVFPFGLPFSLLTGTDTPDLRSKADLIFVLVLFGTIFKGGFLFALPWVTIVHPRSPTLTHALTLGATLKVIALYPFLRIMFEFLPPGPAWWGLVTIHVAAATMLIAAVAALRSHDLKTAFAAHSIENFGIILFSFGLALIFRSWAEDTTHVGDRELMQGLAILSVLAGLYHAINHAFFKMLLYVATATIEVSVGEVAYKCLSGLLAPLSATEPKRLKHAGYALLFGAFAICGLPPLNGFVSEWLIITTSILAITPKDSSFILTGLPIYVIALALVIMVAALGFTLTGFIKIIGCVLLGKPSQGVKAALSQSKAGLGIPELVFSVLALGCIILAAIPGVIVERLALLTSTLFPPAWTTSYKASIKVPSMWEVNIFRDATHPFATLNLLPVLYLIPITLGIYLFCRALTSRSPMHQSPKPRLPWQFGDKPHDPAPDEALAFSRLLAHWSAPNFLPGWIDFSNYGRLGLPKTIIDLPMTIAGWIMNGDIRRYISFLLGWFIVALSLIFLLKGM